MLGTSPCNRPNLVHNDRLIPQTKTPARVLCISGHDPGGGAGLQADIEACLSLDTHALVAVTMLTVQDTSNVSAIYPIDVEVMNAQIEAVCNDGAVAAIKLGVIASPAQVDCIADWIDRLQVPVVLDPVLRAGGGATLAGQPVAQALLDKLMPRATVATPNADEARLLTACSDPIEAARALGALGCRGVLVTGGDEAGEVVINHWWYQDSLQQHHWPRIDGRYHGSGCSLASAIAALLARGHAVDAAVREAEALAHQWLLHPRQVGRGRLVPGRRPAAGEPE
jgi:hydroxymethylpyrimidine/phosphomethylpyrimidine kinase